MMKETITESIEDFGYDTTEAQEPSESLSKRTCVWLVLALVFAIYAFQFFTQDGRTHVSPDGKQYIALAEGETVASPYNNRVLKPKIAAALAALATLSIADAFRILTPVELFAALLILPGLLKRRGSDWFWQSAVLLALGAPTAFLFGNAPVLIDTLVLFLVCLLIELLDREKIFWALLCVCLAVLTKEYCILLAIILAVHLYRKGLRVQAIGAALLPMLVLFINMRWRSGGAGNGIAHLLGFLSGTIKYELEVLGSPNAHKILYIWLWTALWPLFLITLVSAISQFKKDRSLSGDHLNFALMALATPLLLTGDWNRSLLIAVPFVCVAATSHRLAQDRRFALCLAVGGVATALATPFYETAPPRLLIWSLTAISFLASILLLLILGRFYLSNRLQPS